MIVKSSDRPEIGKIYRNWQLNWHDGRIINNHPCYVIREATKEEFLKECRLENFLTGMILESDRFYEISVD